MRFDIPPQALDTALYAFTDQAHLSLEFPQDGVGNVQSAGVSGVHGGEEALALLLAGSGYAFERVTSDAYRIIPTHHASLQQPAPAEAETVVVTAGRRPTPLNELPRSLTHIDAAALSERNAHDLNEVVAAVGGLSRTNTGLGRDKMLLRGISDGALTGLSQSTVGLYLDGLRLTYSAPDPDLELVDIRDVDILRGPQGALYGAGSIGGIVQIESNPVDLFNYGFAAAVESESVQSGHSGSNLEAIANFPIVQGVLGVRAVAYDQELGGWLDNPTIGATDTNSVRRRGGRVTTTFSGGDWDISAFGVYQTIDAQDSQYVRVGDEDERDTHLLEPHDNDFLSVGLALHASTSFGDITSTTAHVRHQISSRYDATGSFAAVGVDPAQVRPFDEKQTLNIIIHETRVTAPTGSGIPWVLGVFYADGDNRRDNVLREGPANIWDRLAYAEGRTDAIDEAAVFGEVTWPLTSHLSLSTGLRLFQFRVKTASVTSAPLIASTDTFAGSVQTSGAAPDLRLSYQLNSDALFYLSVARGYRGGGFNTGGAPGAIGNIDQPFRHFGGDDLVATELGARLILMDRRLSLNAGLFYYRWNNIQSDALIAGGFPFTATVGDGVAYGLEAEARFKLTSEFSISGNALVNEPDVKRRSSTYLGVLQGEFPGAPEISASAALHYQRPLALRGATWSIYGEAEAAYVGRAALTFDAPETVGGYLSGNVRLGMRSPDWDFSIYADNITSAENRTFASGNPYAPTGRPFITPPSPRIIGVSVRRSF